MKQPFSELLDGVGTYLKAIWYPDGDALIVLYLRPDGRFLFAGYWEGYERSIAAGRWLKRHTEIALDGWGHLKTDVIPGPEGGRFQRVFSLDNSTFTPTLEARDELEGWSLLGSGEGHSSLLDDSQ